MVDLKKTSLNKPDLFRIKASDYFHQFELEKIGRLHQLPGGYTYLDVDNDYFAKIFSKLKIDEKALGLFTCDPGEIGAHISVIYENEINSDLKISERGDLFSFELGDLLTVKINQKTYLVIEIFSDYLAKLRAKYGLDPSRLDFKGYGVPFHLTLGFKL